MSRKQDSFFYRPTLFSANLFSGRPGSGSAAMQALIDPQALSPEEAKTLSERYGIKGFMGGILDGIFDPVTLFALVTSFQFPIPKTLRFVKKIIGGKEKLVPENMFALSKKLAKDQERILGVQAPLRSLQSNFAGTAIPDLFDQFSQTRLSFLEKFLGKVGDSVRKYEKSMGRALSKGEGVLVAASMEGLHKHGPIGFKKVGRVFKSMPDHAAFKTLQGDIRGSYDMVFDELFGDPDNQQRLMSALKKMSRQLHKSPNMRSLMGKQPYRLPDYDPDDPAAMKLALEKYFKKLPEYFPHMPTRASEVLGASFRDAFESVQKFTDAPLPGREGFQQASLHSLLSHVTGSAVKRRMRMLPSLEHLDLVKDHVDPRAYEAIKEALSKDAAQVAKHAAQGLPPTPSVIEYSMDMLDTTSKYGHMASSTVGWTAKGIGVKVLDETTRLREAGDRIRVKQLMDTYIPAMLGKMTYTQAQHAEVWTQRLSRMHNWLESSPAWVGDNGKASALGETTKGVRKFLKDLIIDDRGQFAIGPLNRQLAGYLYVGALGGNVSSAVRNLSQLILTTGPTLGLKYTGIGIQNAFAKTETYMKLRFGKHMQHAEAFQRAFPEYHKAGISGSLVVDEVFGRRLDDTFSAFAGAPPGKGMSLNRVKEVSKSALMSFFTASENANRLITFEGTMAKALADAAESAKHVGKKFVHDEVFPEALKVARKTVQNTQFVSGIENSPYIISEKGPVLRQFMHFPLRYLEYLTSTTKQMGSAQMSGRGMQLGNIGRALLWSELFGRVGMEAFDLDLDTSLMPGAFPGMRSHGPFAPMPFVPPALQLAAAPALDMARGDSSMPEMRRSLALLVPGGVAASRAVGFLPKYGEGAAKFLGKRYADYNSPTPDGKVPVFTPAGNLTGHMGPADIFMAATGLAEGGPGPQAEGGAFGMLRKNRDRVRAEKREFVRAVTRGDLRGAEAIDVNFKAAFGVSVRKLISEQDFKNERLRKQITRAEKMIDTMPPELRPMYVEALQGAMMNLPPEYLGFGSQEALQSGPTARSRTGRATRPPQAPYNQSMGPFAPGRLPLNQVSFGASSQKQPALSGFSSFDYD